MNGGTESYSSVMNSQGKRMSNRLLVLLVSVASSGVLAACATPARVVEPDVVAPPEGPSIRQGPFTPADIVAVVSLLDRAGRALTSGDPGVALSAASQVVERYANVPGSASALLQQAWAHYRLDRFGDAMAAAERFSDLVPADDTGQLEVLFIRGMSLVSTGQPAQGLTTLMALPPDTRPGLWNEALAGVRVVAQRLDTGILGDVIRLTPAGQPLLSPLLVEYALAWHFQGEPERATEFAQIALTLPLQPTERRLARAVLDGGVDEVLGRGATVAALLPYTSSPTLEQYATLIEEGIRVAIAADARRTRRPVRLQVFDTEGDPTRTAALVRQAEEAGAVAMIGPVLPQVLAPMLAARSRPMPVLAPTARVVPAGQDGAFALSGPNPGAARSVARYAIDAGIERVLIVSPATADYRAEAAAFAEVFTSEGGTVVGQLTYPPGSVFFEEPLKAAEAARPDGLFLPLPPGDIELLAPEFEHFGLDTLGIQILGNTAWTSAQTFERVEARHTHGVVAATSTPPGGTLEAYDRFVQEYEAFFQKSLVSTIPTLGYDAAGLLLEGLRSGANSPEQLTAALDGVTSFAGATGTLSIEGGRIERAHSVVHIRDERLLPLYRHPN